MNPVLGKNVVADKLPEKEELEDEEKDEKEKLTEDEIDFGTEEKESEIKEDEIKNDKEIEKGDLDLEDNESEDDEPAFMNSKKEDVDASFEDFGFVVGEDVANIEETPVVISKQPEKILENREYVSDFQSERNNPERKEKDELRVVGKDMTGYELHSPTGAKLASAIKPKKTFSGLKNIKFPKFSTKAFIPIIVVLLILTSVGSLYAYFIAPEATVNVKVKYETINLEKDIVSTTEVTDVDLGNLKIPLILQEVEESGSNSANATGSEVKGEKAKGKVTLVNKTEDVLQLESGTVLTGSSHKFLLTSNQEVPAADIYGAGTYGRVEVSVEAYDIGTEYNLSAGVDFAVEGYSASALAGRNSAAFSGGTKETVTVVTASDRDSLKEALENSLKERVKTKVKTQVGEGFILNDSMIDVETVEETYDVDAGEEANSVNLNMKVKAKALVYSEEDLKTLGKQLLQTEIPSGLKLLEEQSEYNADFVSRVGDTATLKLKIIGVISGDITIDSIKEQISGKKYDEAKSILDSSEAITDYSLTLGPSWLPSFFKHVPTIKGKIEIELSVDKETENAE
jgi:hypothetical protein